MVDHTDEHPRRMFFGCKDYKLGFPHLMEWWDKAMMEEFLQLISAVENPGFGFRQPETEERETLLRTEAELAQVKKQLIEIRHFRRVEVTTSVTVIAVIVCLFSYAMFG
ncbi:unnamed protein product [Microthlaspi erraticum]|uniref:Uncharacterized protein n=1 Tax=Microthlaspi erraticum TaxID=1685480 RepID=A0A6D2KPK1_9BRAS|nr:unnamed protein product [Microthlaspi erraticum]